MDKSEPLFPFPWPQKGNCSTRGWEQNSLTLAAATAYQNIYDNHKGMLDDLVGFWEESAKQFESLPGVIGYETMNEPQVVTKCSSIVFPLVLEFPLVPTRKMLKASHT